MITDIRTQQKYLDALKAAEPLLNEVGRYGIALMEEDEKTINTVADDIETKINDEYQVMLNFKKLAEDQKEAVLQGLQLIRNFYHTGDGRVLQLIIDNLPRLQIALEGRTPSSPEDASSKDGVRSTTASGRRTSPPPRMAIGDSSSSS